MNKFFGNGKISYMETSTTTTGMNITRFSLSIKRRGRQATDKATYDNIPCVAFGTTSDMISRNYRDGDYITVGGSLQSNRYEKDGKKITSYSMVIDDIAFSGASQFTSADEPVVSPFPDL